MECNDLSHRVIGELKSVGIETARSLPRPSRNKARHRQLAVKRAIFNREQYNCLCRSKKQLPQYGARMEYTPN